MRKRVPASASHQLGIGVVWTSIAIAYPHPPESPQVTQGASPDVTPERLRRNTNFAAYSPQP
jgi:hypothetical protein